MSTTIDFTGIKAEFEPLPADVYEAVFTGFKIGKSKANEPKLDLEFTVNHPEYKGRKAFATRSLQPQSLWAVKRDMIALGADEEDLDGPIDIEEALDDLKGNDCSLAISVREYDGRLNNQIDSITAA